jgi:hypothetical protein
MTLIDPPSCDMYWSGQLRYCSAGLGQLRSAQATRLAGWIVWLDYNLR